MSEKNIGKNGQEVGTAAYFETINKKSIMRGVFTDCGDHHYVDQINGFSERIKSALEEIYDDLKSYARVLQHLPDECRREMVKFVKGVDDVNTLLKKGTTKAYDCISLLELRDYNTRPKSNADIRKIRDVADEIQRERFFRCSDIVEILRKAKDYGIRYVSGDTAQIIYVTELCGEDKDFYDDVLLLLYYRNRLKHFEGKCGKAVCSKDYLAYHKSKIFASELPISSVSGSSYNYADNMRRALDNIYEEIKGDLEVSNSYLSVENINKLNLVSDDFEKLIGKGFSDKLDTEITGVSNINGLLLDRDFEVLSDDDLAVVKALNSEYLYYEQKQDKSVMEAIGYEIVKIRQKDIYFDRYNPGPYVDKVGYRQDERIIVNAYVMSRGMAWSEGGVDETNDMLYSIISLLDITGVVGVLDYLLFFLSLSKEQRAKKVLAEGDINISIRDWYASTDKESFYKRNGMHIVSDVDYWLEDKSLDKTIINPDIEVQKFLDIAKEFFDDEFLFGIFMDKIKNILRRKGWF